MMTATETPTTIPRLCTTGTVVCLATGPSLTREDAEYCRGKATVVALNDAYTLAPWADVLYSSDARWYPFHNWVPSFAGLKIALDIVHDGVLTIKHSGSEGIDWEADRVRGARNTGGAAINLAVHLGAKRIILLGYDMDVRPGVPRHFFGDHPPRLDNTFKPDVFRELIATMVKPLHDRGIEVINCSRSSRLTCFPQMALRDAL